MNGKEAILDASRVMNKEIKLQENLDCSCSGTTAVVAIWSCICAEGRTTHPASVVTQ
ncbi:hypothetical protein JHK87_008966 [Glycine soja]|nr:hypothetical protein JHK87_008966 [Glycine soja]